MAKFIKYFILITALLFGFQTSSFAILDNNKTDFDLIYESQREVKFEYWNNEDPFEKLDVQGYHASPYPLLRLSEPLKIKNLRIDSGYYLLTPRSEERLDFVMFKQKGQIVAFVPVFEKKKIDRKKVYKNFEPPKPKVSLKKKILMLPITIIKLPFKIIFWPIKKLFFKDLHPLEPMKCALETKYVQGEKYYLMELYVEDYLYRMLFATEVNN